MSNRGRHRKKKFNKLTIKLLREIVDSYILDESTYKELKNFKPYYVKPRKT